MSHLPPPSGGSDRLLWLPVGKMDGQGATPRMGWLQKAQGLSCCLSGYGEPISVEREREDNEGTVYVIGRPWEKGFLGTQLNLVSYGHFEVKFLRIREVRWLTDSHTACNQESQRWNPVSRLLIWSSLLPASLPSTKKVIFFFTPPRGEDHLNCHSKLFASLNHFPTVQM